jgi:hypothetical protein
MGLFKNDPPPPPNLQPLIDLSAQQAKYANEQSQKQFDWAKSEYERNRPNIDKITGLQINLMQQQYDQNQLYKPIEEAYAKRIQDLQDPQYKERQIGAAQAGVAQQFDAARQNAQHNLESYGIRPDATRAAALDIGARTQQAATEAGAGTQAGLAADAMAFNALGQGVNSGRGLAAQAAGIGTSAGNLGNATQATGAGTMGTGTQWAGVGSQAASTSANIANAGFQNQNTAWTNQNQWLRDLGALGGAAVGWASGMTPASGNTNFTTNFGKYFGKDGGLIQRFQDGGEPDQMVPPQASPTGGQQTDDVPARVNVGEFIVPKDTVSWKGEEFFQKLIAKAREEKSKATAKPRVGPAPPQAPTFVSRPNMPQSAGLLPVR